MHLRWLTMSLVAGLLCGAVGRADDSLHVKTDKGVVEGTLAPDGAVRAFKGIPFAAPPVGELRWKAPAPYPAWRGVRQTGAFGYHCVQMASFADMMFHDTGASEDCLTLNVWAPAGAKAGTLR